MTNVHDAVAGYVVWREFMASNQLRLVKEALYHAILNYDHTVQSEKILDLYLDESYLISVPILLNHSSGALVNESAQIEYHVAFDATIDAYTRDSRKYTYKASLSRFEDLDALDKSHAEMRELILKRIEEGATARANFDKVKRRKQYESLKAEFEHEDNV